MSHLRRETIWKRVDTAPRLSDLAVALLVALNRLSRNRRKMLRWTLQEIARLAGVDWRSKETRDALDELKRAKLVFRAAGLHHTNWRIAEAGALFLSETQDADAAETPPGNRGEGP